MKITSFSTLLIPALVSVASFAPAAAAETTRDCVMEGTVKKHSGDSGKVYVAFHSAEAAEDGAKCRMRRNEKLQFKQPAQSELNGAKPGTRVEYRYTEDSEKGANWELKDVTSS